MKIKLTTILISIFFLSTSITDTDVHVITLNVDTATINRSNINDVCYFTPVQNVTLVDYNTMVSLGDIVLWKGKSTSSTLDLVNIHSINHEGGTRVFNRNVLRPDRQSPGVVSGTVTEGSPGKFQKYKILFTVERNGNQIPGTFQIDPKITMRE